MRVLPSDLTTDFCGGRSASSRVISFSGEARNTMAMLPPEKRREQKPRQDLCSAPLFQELIFAPGNRDGRRHCICCKKISRNRPVSTLLLTVAGCHATKGRHPGARRSRAGRGVTTGPASGPKALDPGRDWAGAHGAESGPVPQEAAAAVPGGARSHPGAGVGGGRRGRGGSRKRGRSPGPYL